MSAFSTTEKRSNRRFIRTPKMSQVRQRRAATSKNMDPKTDTRTTPEAVDLGSGALLGEGKKPTISEVLPLVRAYYAKPGNDVGGCLHVVLDDGNVADGHVRACMEFAKKQGDAAGVELAQVILRMSKTQRRKLARMKHA